MHEVEKLGEKEKNSCRWVKGVEKGSILKLSVVDISLDQSYVVY